MVKTDLPSLVRKTTSLGNGRSETMRHDTKFHKSFLTARPATARMNHAVWNDRFIERKLSAMPKNPAGELCGQELAGKGEFVFEGEVLTLPGWHRPASKTRS